ncbi:hypothetical protein E2562_020148 [Oryza meyeriana var. granulata]|uniref:Uncharacterized protein n=1 Tax=Oryza meyeriana var. granulata TaxID=110450 RepID=A0A6G1BLZ8_9ORYZ|nr:hypothetical protein E2562_020148 [Oryza meyeriana var. granulata]
MEAPLHQSPQAAHPEAASNGGGLLLGSDLLGSAPLLALGAAPLLEGRLGFDLGLGQPGDVLGEQLGFGAMAPAPLLWSARILEGDTWKTAAAAGVYSSPAAALWQELAAAAPVELAGGLRHGGAPQLM